MCVHLTQPPGTVCVYTSHNHQVQYVCTPHTTTRYSMCEHHTNDIAMMWYSCINDDRLLLLTGPSVAVLFSKSSAKAQEYTEKAAVQIKAVGDFSSPFNVMVVCASTGRSPATAGDDFNASPITVRFTPTEKVQTINIPVVDDNDCEQRETFACNVRRSSLPTFATTRGKVTVSIIDNSKREDDCRGKQYAIEC